MKRVAVLSLAVLAAAALVTCQTKPGSSALPPFAARLSVIPKQGRVFYGESLQFAAAAVGVTQPFTVRWTLVGPGTIDQQGRYHAPPGAAVADVVASAGSGLADSASVQTVPPPGTARALAFVSCYEDATLQVHDATDLHPLGSLSLQGQTAGIATDRTRGLALIASGPQVYALNFRTMHWRPSQPFSNARFSEAVRLADGLFAVSDNDALNEQPGIRVFRVDASGVPKLVSSAAAGETPEGLAVADGGRTLYVTNINSNSVMRFVLRRDHRLTRTGMTRTGNRPFGIAVDPAARLVFVADNDTTTVSGPGSRPGLERFALPSLRRVGTVISTGSPTSLPLGVAVDAPLHRLFVVNEGDADVVVFAVPSMRRLAVLSTGLTPWLPALDGSAHRLFVPNARSNSVDVFDTKQLRAQRRGIATCDYPTFVGLTSG